MNNSAFFHDQQAYSVQYTKECNANIRKNRHPHFSITENAKDHNKELDTQGEHNVLPGNAHGTLGNGERRRQPGEVIAHQNNISSDDYE